jgi:MFS family permease
MVMLLMLLNWGLEAVKWKRLIKSVEPITLWKAIESVFCGLTWAVFTPNRLGEYGGRVFFLSPKRRIVGVVAMAVGNIGQMVITNVFGSIALSVFIYSFNLLDYRLCLAVFAIAAIFCLFFLVFYFNIKWLNTILLSSKYTRKYKKFYIILARYKKIELLKILLFCLARYLVFSTEYFIMFHWLVPGIDYIHILMLVSILFFVQSSLPSLDLLDIGIRSVTALFFFKFVTDQSTAVVACIASIWFINLIIPAILGVYFVFKLNFFGSNKHS